MPPWTGFAAGDVFNSPCQISKTASSGSNAPVDRKTVTPKPESRLQPVKEATLHRSEVASCSR